MSAGQRQRIAIARAIIKDPKILILDEASSNLDVVSESLVHQALERLMTNKTVMLITHRLNTIKNEDYIIVLDKGKVAEQGTKVKNKRKGCCFEEFTFLNSQG